MSDPQLASALANLLPELAQAATRPLTYVQTVRAIKQLYDKTMARKRKSAAAPRRRRPRRPRGRRSLGYMRPTNLPTKTIMLWSDATGTTGKWYININLSALIKQYTSVFDEFRVNRLTVVYKPNNSVSETGLMVGVLMDQKGFGGYGTASETAWFKTLGSMPGSKITPRHVATSYFWKPTEPDSREWRSYQRSETNYTVATLYMADNGKETAELGGIFEIRAILQGRGRYYNIATMLQAHQAEETGASPSSDFDMCTNI